jgi:hypothetical protein
MVRRLAWIRYCLGAIVLLGLAAGALELGLRLADPWAADLESAAGEETLTIPCSVMHHRLRPLAAIQQTAPDGQAAVEIRTNSYGLRGMEPAVPKPPGVYRVVCLGDETVFAPEVDESETFCRRLEELLQPHTRFRVEVINAGVPGYCPLLSFLLARQVVLGLQPDVIVLHVDMSDIADDHRYRRFIHTDESGIPLACSHPDLERAMAQGQSWFGRLELVRWGRRQFLSAPEPGRAAGDRFDIDAREGRYAWLRDDAPDWTTYIDQALAPVVRLREAADQVYARLVVSTCAAPWQVSEDASSGARSAAGVPKNVVYRSRAPFEKLAAFAAQQGIPFCDASPVFQHSAEGARLYAQNSRGLSAAGHELYARELALFLVEQVPGVWIENERPEPYRPMDDYSDPTRQALRER